MARSVTHHPKGRRPLPPELRRRRRVQLWLTEAELEKVRQRAEQARLPVAAYARAAALRESPPGPVPVLNIQFVGELGRLANNLNQLTKLAHQGRTSPLLLPCLRAILAEVRKIRRQLIGLQPDGQAAAGEAGSAGGD
jgi:hypothetical protein